MKYEAILFDLDGTLLPMDNDEFTNGYFGLLTKAVAPHGYEKEPFLNAMMRGVAAMTKNDGSRTNEQAFWDTFTGLLGQQANELEAVLERFYETDFHKTICFTKPTPLAKEAVHIAKERGARLVLATNPLFPLSAVSARLTWLDLQTADFEWITDYKSIGYCKPNPAYYLEICHKLRVSPEKCLMVGNNAAEDGDAAVAAGLDAFLITDCLVGRTSGCRLGSLTELIDFLKTL